MNDRSLVNAVRDRKMKRDSNRIRIRVPLWVVTLIRYNRQVYGILYHQVLNRIKYGFTDEMAQQIRDELIRAGAYLK